VEFYIKNKALGSILAPVLNEAGVGDAVKAGIEFDEVKLGGIPVQALGRGDFFGVPGFDETGVRPTGSAYKYFSGHKTSLLET
jgi:hypothetical protein